VSPEATSYVSPAAATRSTVAGGVAAAVSWGAGDAPGDANGGRCGLGATAGAAAGVAGTAVGVGAAAPPPQALVSPSAIAAKTAMYASPPRTRRELRFRRTLAS
jgi:hypothetical protein